ncbi:MAG: ribosomal protein S18-alanine N-acetyltransferase [Clostridia bacterium]|nr:ribosomal protein S18-alanine N-acetyltransferase [Clostridia bacterium]
MIIKRLEKTDIPALTAIENACFPDAWSALSWQEEFSRAEFIGFACKDGERLIGYVCGTRLFEESELLKIAVAPNARKQGVGEQLLAAFCTEAKTLGAEKMFLEVRESNVPALRLYQKSGFTPTRVRKRYYENGENAVEMVKTL